MKKERGSGREKGKEEDWQEEGQEEGPWEVAGGGNEEGKGAVVVDRCSTSYPLATITDKPSLQVVVT